MMDLFDMPSPTDMPFLYQQTTPVKLYLQQERSWV